MARLTLVFSALLIALGLVAYFLLQDPGDRSVTALIPAFFGVVFAGLGLLALKPGLRKHAMHAAAVLTLLAMAGTGGSLANLPAAIEAAGQPAARTEADETPAEPPEAEAEAEAAEETEPELRVTATIIQSIMFGLSTVFLIACVASFVNARRGAKDAA